MLLTINLKEKTVQNKKQFVYSITKFFNLLPNFVIGLIFWFTPVLR